MRHNAVITTWLAVASIATSRGSADDSAGRERVRGLPDLSAIARTIAKEPAYTSDRPLYGLFAFGPEAATRAWAVLDQSRKDGEGYDVLYFDRDADGDLTDPDERIAAARPDVPGHYSFGSFVFIDAAEGARHRLTLNSHSGGALGGTALHREKDLLSLGFAEEAVTRTQLATRPEEAPIYRLALDGPLEFQRYEPWDELRRGKREELNLLVGCRGLGFGSFSATATDRILPSKVPIRATLNYTDADGAARAKVAELLDRACSVICFGKIEVPADARPGPASVRFEVTSPPANPIVPWTVPVTIVEGGRR